MTSRSSGCLTSFQVSFFQNWRYLVCHSTISICGVGTQTGYLSRHFGKVSRLIVRDLRLFARSENNFRGLPLIPVYNFLGLPGSLLEFTSVSALWSTALSFRSISRLFPIGFISILTSSLAIFEASESSRWIVISSEAKFSKTVFDKSSWFCENLTSLMTSIFYFLNSHTQYLFEFMAYPRRPS